MSLTEQTLTLEQGDDATVVISAVKFADGTFLDLSGAATATLALWTSKTESTTVAGTVYAGVIAGNSTTGWTITAQVPRADLAQFRRGWFRARCTPVVGSRAGKVTSVAKGAVVVA